jgi:FkbM family methyltransferase
VSGEFRCNWYGIGDIIQFCGFLHQWMQSNRKRPKLHVISWYAQEILERYKAFFDLLPEEDGPYLLDSDRRKWYSDHRLPFVNTGFYPVTAEERAWAENYWGPKRPRWFVQLHGSGHEKSHRHWEHLIRFVHGYCGGQTFCLDDAKIKELSIAEGLALAATCDRFVGFDSGPFWAATANGAEAVALFPGGSPDTLYPVKAKPRIKVAYCPRSADRVPISDVVQFVVDHWNIPFDLIPMTTPTGLAFYAPKQNPAGEWLDSGEEMLPWADAWMNENSGGVGIDGGLFTGGWTDYLAARCDRVYGFDPSSEAVKVTRTMCDVRGHRNVTLRNAGLSDKPGRAFLTDSDRETKLNDDQPSWGMQAHFGDGNVPMTTLDEAIPPDANVRTICLDVEGHEAAALRGAKRIISRCRPGIFIEIHQAHNFYDEDVRGAVYKVLSGRGYNIYEPSPHWFLNHAYAFPREKDPFQVIRK